MKKAKTIQEIKAAVEKNGKYKAYVKRYRNSNKDIYELFGPIKKMVKYEMGYKLSDGRHSFFNGYNPENTYKEALKSGKVVLMSKDDKIIDL